jgi:hypothetical protein
MDNSTGVRQKIQPKIVHNVDLQSGPEMPFDPDGGLA